MPNMKRTLILLFTLSFSALAGHQAPKERFRCENVAPFQANTHQPMHLGVHFETKDKRIIQATLIAISFWTTVLDMTWDIDDNPKTCSINVVEVSFPNPKTIAKAQMPEQPEFEGLMFWQPSHAANLGYRELFNAANHEFGHMFGLNHSGNPQSLMYDRVTEFWSPNLDKTDLASLSNRYDLCVKGSVAGLRVDNRRRLLVK